MKIGLFGGSFDPIHNGHLMLAEQARTQLGLDEIWFIPCGKSPYKDKSIKTSNKNRLKMLCPSLDFTPFQVMSYEMDKIKISYTIDTIKYILNTCKKWTFILILGPDITPKSFTTWKDYKEIKKLVKVVFAGKDFWIPDINIRSTLIRKMIKEGKSIKYLVPNSVEEYIKEKGLYK